MTTKGEARNNGRKLTLDPIGWKQTVTIPAWEVESTIPCGFRLQWVSGENAEAKVELSCGAGVGSKWGTFHYTRKSDGARVEIVFEAGDLVERLSDLAEQKLMERDVERDLSECE